MLCLDNQYAAISDGNQLLGPSTQPTEDRQETKNLFLMLILGPSDS